MFELTFGLVVGACVGYGVRAFISHCRHLSTRRRLGMS
jgi:NhaP-type Na+/H+ or K+/H+ antiporter